jgi:VAD1 Analog of StAR-related lipid transfer domain/GRAM domain
MKGFKKVLPNRRRSSEPQSDSVNPALRTDSIDSLSLDKSPTRQSTHSSLSRDGSSRSGSSGLRTLLPGHTKRKRRRVREEELRVQADELSRGRELSQSNSALPLSRKTSSIGDNSLLTDDSEVETPPPLVSRDSHTGYLTTSSPFIRASTGPEQNDATFENNGAVPNTVPAQSVPTLVEPQRPESSPSPKSPPVSESTPDLPIPGLIDKADTLRLDPRRNSIGKLRSKSPVRKFKDVFRPSKSPRTSPERKAGEPVSGVNSPLSRSSTVALDIQDDDGKSPYESSNPDLASRATFPALDTKPRPLTPPASLMTAPLTTVTPPTPTDTRFSVPDLPNVDNDGSSGRENPNVVVSPSGNMISHRRVRSAGSVSHQPSKLSSSITAPLTPTIEESRTPSGSSNPANRSASGNFFSSWMSVAQNAASTFTNLTGPNRSRTSTNASDPASQKTATDTIKEEPETNELESPRKQLAVETLGSGELNLDQLVSESDPNLDTPQKPSLAELRHDSTVERDISAAKAEDALAKRAVSAAYEKPTGVTPVAEAPDLMNNIRHSQTFSGAIGGDQTPPNGSIIDSEATSVKRTNSVRSKLANRRSRGSSVATGQSAIGAMISSSTLALANPSSGPKLSGFSMAPKQRNRNFHQQFRSVPEDDHLIEDYSCALQKEILLAGRIYISEGHICFSSNILGWVTTLVISFEEVVNVERENTALVIPNAIAIHTLHAKHTFRSFLSREATYELLIGIWKVSHPANFQKSIVGKQVIAEEATKDATGTGAGEKGSEKGSEKRSEGSSEEGSDSDEDDESALSIIGSAPSMAGSDLPEPKSVSRKPSGMNGPTLASTPGPGASGEHLPGAPTASGAADGAQDFPGPSAHPPTECTDSSTHYDIIIKDEVLPAPLGKIYSLLYGPQSGAFVRKFLVDECKSLDLVLEDDKKGLSKEKKSRQYTYIKPLGGSIGPKQTKCITTEDLDFFDLEKAVTVTCSTQTPDVPSGNAFVTKTRYCITWAAGNQTRFQMNCTIEWSAKSWLKGPIEKGARDGQQQYGDTLVKFVKATVGRPRGMTGTSKVSKSKRKGKKEKRGKAEKVEEQAKEEENWGLLEPLRGTFGPFVDMAKPLITTQVVVGVLCVMVLWMWIRGPSGTQVGPYAGLKQGGRIAAYEEMWRREESELWEWLERRAGLDAVTLQQRAPGNVESDQAEQKRLRKERQQVLKGKDMNARLREERMSEMEMEAALKVTRERLEVLEGVVKKKGKNEKSGSV